MAFATISTWKMGADLEAEAMARIMQDQFMPALRSLGATQAMTVQTGKGTSAIISVYPDEATRNAAMEKIKVLREKGASTFSAEMTGELMGTVIASA
jgi:Trk K+ transport system NAD-binding subunit